jgi:hypothetical protein
MAVVLPFLLGLAAFVESGEEPAAGKLIASTSAVGILASPQEQGPLLAASALAAGRLGEVKSLIKELGDEDFQVRETATKRLAEIGVPALGALREAEAKGDAETSRRAEALIRSISAANRLPTRVKGMEFKLTLSKNEWTVPPPGGRTVVNASLQVTNTSDEVYRLYLDGVVKFVLQDAARKPMRCNGGREGKSSGPLVSPPLRKNESFTIAFTGALWRTGEKDGFYLGDNLRNFWQFEMLAKGTYYLGLVYECKKQATDDGPPLWLGRTETLMEAVEIK